MVYCKGTHNAHPEWWATSRENHAVHLPFAQRAERRAEAQWSSSRFAVATRQLSGRWLFLWGLDFVGWAGSRLDVEVFQHIIVDLGGDPLLFQHLFNGLFGIVGSDWGAFFSRASLPIQTNSNLNSVKLLQTKAYLCSTKTIGQVLHLTCGEANGDRAGERY